MTKVSVITTFLNADRFIQEAIGSLFAQTYKHWELLLVDDGSTDKSTTIAQRCAHDHPGVVRYLEHEGHRNRGISASRNLGISHARGEYISFLDADDVWFPHKLEQQVAILDSQPDAALVGGRTQWWYSWTGNPKDIQRDFTQQFDIPLDTLVEPPTMLILFLRNEWAALCDLLVRRAVVDAVEGFDDAFRGSFDDHVFRAKVFLKWPVFVSSACWYRYRQHPDSCCSISRATGRHFAVRQTFLTWLEAYMSEQEIDDAKVRRFVHKRLWPSRHPRLARLVGRFWRLMHRVKKNID